MKKLIAAAAVLAVAATPAAFAKGKPEDPGSKGKGHTKPAKTKKAKNVVAHGTIASIDGDQVTVTVTKANKHGRDMPTLTITAVKFSVADVNSDGAANLADFAVGDEVVAHSKGGKLISKSHPEVDEDEAAPVAPAPAV